MNAVVDPKPTDATASNPTIQRFDAAGRFWTSASNAPGIVASVPVFDGSFVTDPASLTPAADDFGHIVHRTPLALLQPDSIDDVLKMVRFASEHGLQLASRGNGHTAFGQSQVEAGIVIDVSSLNRIHRIEADRAVVDAGVVWRDLLRATTAVGLTPPVLTDYTRLTVGGTLSVGGVSGRSYQHGAQVDNVIELQVVTAEGRLVTCSDTEHKDLFDMVLAGLGQAAIIVRATIRLIPAKERALTQRLFYPDVSSMLADLRYLVRKERFDYVRGNITPPPGVDSPDDSGSTAESTNAFVYFIEATSFYTTSDDLPADPRTGLRPVAGSEQVEDRTYFEFTDIVVQLVDLLDEVGLGNFPHPWLDLFVPNSRVDEFTSQIIAQLDPADFLPGSLMLLYPFVRSKLTRPLFRVPDDDLFFLFDILRTVPPDPAAIETVLAQNRTFYEQNRAFGGTFYAISAVPMESDDWQTHFGTAWEQLVRTKRQYDPTNVLPFFGRQSAQPSEQR